jgi:antitoxin ParD1/3/4
MKRNTSITLGDHFSAFVHGQVEAGRFGSASEVVRAGLRLLEESEAATAELRAQLLAGAESGDPVPFDFQAYLASKE